LNIKLPPVIQKYVDSNNRHDVDSILSCFSDGAVVCDEGGEFRGRETVRRWILKTIETYKFQLTPLSVKGEKPGIVVAIKVSGAFPGSPVTLDYHFTIERDKILSLTIE